MKASGREELPLDILNWPKMTTDSVRETWGEEPTESLVKQNNDQEERDNFVPKLSARRWLILAGYCLLAMSNLSAWFAFSSISNIVRRYYDISLVTVNWLATTFSVVPLVLMFPLNVILERKGLGFTIVLSSFFNAAGCCVRYIGYSTSNGYAFLLMGSILCAVSTSSYFLPSKVAAVWFGERERATATSIAVSFGLLGISLGYFLPTWMVKNRATVAEIGTDLGSYLLVTSIQGCATFIFIVLTARDNPRSPSTFNELLKYRKKQEAEKKRDAVKETNRAMEEDGPIHNGNCLYRISRLAALKNISIKKRSSYIQLFKSIRFHKILHLHGIIFALESVFLMTLNEMLIPRFPGYEFEVGLMGAIGPVFSLISNFLIGVLIDRTRAFKRISIATTGLSSLLTGLLTLFFYLRLSFVSLFCTYIVIFVVSSTYYTTAFDHSAALTYPVSEGKSGVILIWVAQLYSSVLTRTASFILYRINSQVLLIATLALYSLTFLISLILDDK